jgi:hypothetical protein
VPGDHRAAQLRSHKFLGTGAEEIQDGFIQLPKVTKSGGNVTMGFRTHSEVLS